MIIYDTNDKKIEALRAQRARECFPIVNRGKLWYDLLTLEQEAELLDWYVKWLNVTETFVIPVTPSWLREKLDTEVQYL